MSPSLEGPLRKWRKSSYHMHVHMFSIRRATEKEKSSRRQTTPKKRLIRVCVFDIAACVYTVCAAGRLHAFLATMPLEDA